METFEKDSPNSLEESLSKWEKSHAADQSPGGCDQSDGLRVRILLTRGKYGKREGQWVQKFWRGKGGKRER